MTLRLESRLWRDRPGSEDEGDFSFESEGCWAWAGSVSRVVVVSAQEAGPAARPKAPTPGGPSEPAGDKSARSSPRTPAGEGRAVMALVGRGRHLAAEESVSLVVKPASGETGLRLRVSRYEKALSLELVFLSLERGGSVSPPSAPLRSRSVNLSLELSSLTLCHLNPPAPGSFLEIPSQVVF